MVDAAVVVAADEDLGAAVAAREVLAEVAMREIEEDLIVLLAAQVIVLTNGPEAVVVGFKQIFDQYVICHYIHIKLCVTIQIDKICYNL